MLYTIGQKVNKELSEYLKTYTTGEERADIDELHGKKATANAIVLRHRTVTEDSNDVIESLIKKAHENRKAKESILKPVDNKVIKELKSA